MDADIFYLSVTRSLHSEMHTMVCITTCVHLGVNITGNYTKS